MKKEFKTLSSDIVFKSIFFKNNDLLEWLMNRTFKSLNINYNIKNYNICNGELVVDKVFLRSRTLDALIESDDIVYNLEVNKNFNLETIIRNYLYQCNYLIYMVHTGKKYINSIKPVVQINYNIKTNKKYQYDGEYEDIESKTLKKYYFIKKIVNIDIAKYIDKWYNLNKDKDYYEKYKHFLLLGMTKEDLIELKDDDKMVNKIKNAIFNINDPSEFPRLFSDEEFLEIEKNTSYYNGIEHGIEQGKSIGIEEGKSIGIEEGIEKTNLDNAKKMKEEKIPADIIKKITGLDLKTISLL